MKQFPDKWMFVPGPVNVDPTVRAAMATPPINHRGAEFTELYESLKPKLRYLLQTEGRVLLSTSSAIGLQEAALRNLVARKSLHLVCGAFSEKWFKIAAMCGKPADELSVPWGSAIEPEAVDRALKTGAYDTLCVVHSETSTGVQVPLEGIAEVAGRYGNVLLVVDAVSSLGASPVYVDRWGIDCCFASTQKGIALPPGFTVFALSDEALARAATVDGRGYYFDFLQFDAFDRKSRTIVTPSLSHMFALDVQLDRIVEETLGARWVRHDELAQRAAAWASDRYACFAPENRRSRALTAVKMQNEEDPDLRPFDVGRFNDAVAADGIQLAGGYGKLKSRTFRIGHIGETTMRQLEHLLGRLDGFINKESR